MTRRELMIFTLTLCYAGMNFGTFKTDANNWVLKSTDV